MGQEELGESWQTWEDELRRRWNNGVVADFGAASGASIRAEFLREQYLALSALPKPPITPRRLRGARVVGPLNLRDIDMADHIVLLEECQLDELELGGARVAALRLPGCTVRSISAKELHAPYGVSLEASDEGRPFHSSGVVNIAGANVGRLNCTGGRFCNPDGYALNADGITVDGDVFLDEPFSAKGMVTFVNATIKRQLNCTRGRFRADEAKGIALSLDAAVVGGVYLNEGFDAEGAVLLRWARVERQVNCSKGHFRNGQGTAIDAEHLVCEQNVDLSEANVVGSVVLRDARIRYDLNCGGTDLEPGDSGVAFDGSEMLVQGTLRWRLDVPPGGRVLLTDTEVGQLDDTPQSWSGPQRLDLRGFRYKSLTSASDDVWMRLDWLRRSDYYPQAYEQLQRCYRESGRQEEAAKVGIAGERARLAGTSRRLQKAWGWLLGATIGYGYRPQRAVTLIITIMMTGGILFYYAQHAYLMKPTAPPDKRPISATVCTYGYPCFAPFTYQVDLMIPGANLRQKQYWTPDEGSLPGKILVVWLWWSSLAGWILVTLLVRTLVTSLDVIAKRAAS